MNRYLKVKLHTLIGNLNEKIGSIRFGVVHIKSTYNAEQTKLC